MNLSAHDFSMAYHAYRIGREERWKDLGQVIRHLEQNSKNGADPMPNLMIEMIGELL